MFGPDDLNGDVLKGHPKLVAVWSEEYESGSKMPVRAHLKELAYYTSPSTEPAERLSYRPDGELSYRQIYLFDKGHVSRCDICDAGRNRLRSKHFVRSSDGHILEVVDEDAEGRQTERTVFTFDETGRIVKTLVVGNDTTIKAEARYKYDQDGNLGETEMILRHESNSDVIRVATHHSPQGSMTDTHVNAIHSARVIKLFAEDQKEITTTHFDAAQVQLFSTVERIEVVDAAGNWTTKRLRRLNPATGCYELEMITTRLIAYHLHG